MEWGADFVGLGLDNTVPKYLRTNGKVKNRHMSKVGSPDYHCWRGGSLGSCAKWIL